MYLKYIFWYLFFTRVLFERLQKFISLYLFITAGLLLSHGLA